MSAITRLNRTGPIAFSQLTVGTPYGAINNLIDNVVGTPPTQNISLSASLGVLIKNTGDPTTDTKGDLGLGIGLVTLNQSADARMSEFDGGNYISDCVKSGMCLREKIEEKDLKAKIINIERESLKQGKGLLILTGKVAQMGISLPCADVAFLLDSDTNIISPFDDFNIK